MEKVWLANKPRDNLILTSDSRYSGVGFLNTHMGGLNPNIVQICKWSFRRGSTIYNIKMKNPRSITSSRTWEPSLHTYNNAYRHYARHVIKYVRNRSILFIDYLITELEHQMTTVVKSIGSK